MEKYKQKVTLKNWSESDQPREKLAQKGKSALSDAELLAIIIGSGNREETAVELCRRILHDVDNNLIELSKVNIEQFSKYKGMGTAKAISIIAALELGRRRKEQESPKRFKIKSSLDSYNIFAPHLQDLKHEEFWVLYLSRSNEVIKKEMLSIGGVAGTVVDSKIIFKRALELLASGIILAHNHPSGNQTPSSQDTKLTKRIEEGAKLLDINLLDHLIITDTSYYSFADNGLI